METTLFAEKLMEFGLTRQEACIYQCILEEGKATGYEVAKQTGISRSNAYNALANMQEKGAVYLLEEGNTRKYIPVPLEEFCKNRIRRLEEAKKWLSLRMPKEREETEGYITIEGGKNILDKIRNLLENVEERVYISCTRNYLLLMVRELEALRDAGKKVVIITDRPVTMNNTKVYVGRDRGMQVGVISDSRYVITGEYGEGSMNTALYSGQKHFVELYKRALSNEIELLTLKEEK